MKFTQNNIKHYCTLTKIWLTNAMHFYCILRPLGTVVPESLVLVVMFFIYVC